ncbi:hypothetical protein AC482_02785 [miscellaneous Crenarchaeota group-15 archaeon DG-45]|uniref:ECF transporter S component n=1 Tax=miscellaneous Crenarchaeota group-15 archaeon DG-45 TaxID=1685127 RepID=A0A0M0BQZ7_9ARCH|nr:MAG: hypothetical protein AC482_02785 [miscellaneous Crenarchaeota group-15 archaeon DG-45]
MSRTRMLTLAALMAALSSILSVEPFSIPIVFGPFASRIHFTQLPIFLSGCIAGPLVGFLTGAIGGIYMSVAVSIPFIPIGLGILGFSTGFFAKRLKLRPFLSSILAWCIQSVYVLITDYIWFVSFRLMPRNVALGVVTSILIKMTVEAVISSTLAEVLVHSIRRAGFYPKPIDDD